MRAELRWRSSLLASCLGLLSACLQPLEADGASPTAEAGVVDRLGSDAADESREAASSPHAVTSDANESAGLGASTDAGLAAALDASAEAGVAAALDARAALSCGESWKRAAEELWQAVDSADRSCAQHAECTAKRVHVSCSRECVTGAFSARGSDHLERALGQIEAARCSTLGPDCPALPEESSACTVEGSVARCREGRCAAEQVGCSHGCSADANGVCRGEPHCEGCPSVIGDFIGKPCAKPEQQCGPPGFCPPLIGCHDPDRNGQYRWEQVILLCSARGASH